MPRRRASRRRQTRLPVPPHGAHGTGHLCFAATADEIDAWKRSFGPPASRSKRTSTGRPAPARSISAIRRAIAGIRRTEPLGTVMRKLDDKTLVVASHNAGKIREIRDLMARSALTPNRPPISTSRAGRDRHDLRGKCHIKALASAKASGLPALSDDSGLVRRCAQRRIPASTPPTGPRRPDGTRDFAMAMQKVETAMQEPARPSPTSAPAASSPCSASPGRMAMPSCSAARSKGISSGRRAATGIWLRPGLPTARLRHHIRRNERRGEARLEARRGRGAVAPRPGVQAFRRDLPGGEHERPRCRSAGEPGFGVYVHWPFCAAKCPYCDFNSHVRHQPVDQPRFAAAFADGNGGDAAHAPGRAPSPASSSAAARRR